MWFLLMTIEGQLVRRTEIRIDEGTAKLINSNSNPIPLQPKLDGIFFKKNGNIQNLQITNEFNVPTVLVICLQ